MKTALSWPSWNPVARKTWLRQVVLAFVVAALSYLTARLGLALLVPLFQGSALWPVNAVVVAILLLAPRKAWPVLIVFSLGAAVVSDVKNGSPPSVIAWFFLGNLVEVLMAAWAVRRLDGVLKLDSVKGLAEYLVFVAILPPFVSGFLGANVAIPGSYWMEWRLWFFSGCLAFLIVTPAVVSLVNLVRGGTRKSLLSYLEAAALITGLLVFGALTLIFSGNSSPSAVLFSLSPFLLWAALRFGPAGVSISMMVLSFLSLWCVTHDVGPFAKPGTLHEVLWLQTFLVFAAIPFLILAALVEERKQVDEELRSGEERLRLAMEAGGLGGWEWNLKTGENPWFGGAATLLGVTSPDRSGSIQDFWDRVHPEHREQLQKAAEIARVERKEYDQEFQVVRPDGALRWLRSRGRFLYGPNGEPERMLGISSDVTDRKSAQLGLQRSAAELREAQRLAKVGSWQWVPQTDQVTWSEELYRIHGIDPAEPAVSYAEHSKLFTAPSWERLRHAVEEALRIGTPYELDLERACPDGTTRSFIARGEAQRDATGRVVQLRGTLQDITERKRAEEKLRDSEERFRLAAQAGKMFAYEWDATTDVLVRSAESTRILGIDETTPVTGQQALSRVHPHDRERLMAALGKLSPEKPQLEISYRIVRPDNTVIWVQRDSLAHFDEDSKLFRIVGMITDITDRRKTEDALRASEAWLGMAVRAGRMYAFEWDTATDTILRTGECESIFNWMDDPTRVRGRDFVAGIHADDRESYDALVAGLAPENPNYQISYRVLRPDGSAVWLEANGRAFFDGEGNRLRIIGMVADVTERKLAEEALASVSRRLIDAQDQERAHIARELHDDLSQQMALLQIGLEQFEHDATGLSFQDRQQLHKIAGVAMEVSTNVRNMSHQLHPSKLDTLGLLPSVGSLCKEIGKQYNLQVQFVHQNITTPIPRDVTLCLFRIVQEALRNVVKHSEATTAAVELSSHDDRIDLCVSDGGMGFNPESPKTESGLGFVSMRERLRQVGGHLTIESEPSRGTRICASVPLAALADAKGESKTQRAGG